MAVTIRGSGQVPVQIVQTVKTDTFSSTSTTYVDITGMSVTITPTNTLNKIFINFCISGGAGSMGIFQIVRNSTPIAIGDLSGTKPQSTTLPQQWAGGNGDRGFSAVMTWLDSPSTTSAVTYKLQGYGDAGTWYLNRTASDANAIFGPRAVSSITVMEIAYA
jgi:hypothetical protein